MAKNKKTEPSTGYYKPIGNGNRAFVPAPLPPAYDFNKIDRMLYGRAQRLLGELNGVGLMINKPYLLISPFSRREAVASSRIEGTQASVEDVLYYEIANGDESFMKDRSVEDIREVTNYIAALDYGRRRLDEIPISLRLIKEMHRILMRNVRGKQAAPGQFRKIQNWIGDFKTPIEEAKFIPPPVPEMKKCLDQWEKYIHAESGLDILTQCSLIHYQFEAIHPFLDGNGRIGRLLIILYLCSKKALSQPLLYLSPYFERNREEYYTRLANVSKEGEWKKWCEFFLRAVVEQANYAISEGRKIIELQERYRNILDAESRVPKGVYLILNEIFDLPIATIPRLSAKLKLPYNTVNSGLSRLKKLGILTVVSSHPKIFISNELLDIYTQGM